MDQETIVTSKPDRDIRKKILIPGDYTLVPFEDSRCKVAISEVNCRNDAGPCEIEPESIVFSPTFTGNILIGDSDCFIDKDFEILLQNMCSGETCTATFVYRDSESKLAKEISCKVTLKEVMEEQVISDWSWHRLYEASIHHKETGVQLVKEKKVVEAFRRFSKSLKFLVAIEPVDRNQVDENTLKEMRALKVKLFNNLAHCQLQFNEYEAARDLCERALKLDPDNIKALYRRSLSYSGSNLHEDAWKDIQKVLKLDPNDKAAIQQAVALRPMIEKINKDYTSVIKKMFG